MRKRNLYQKKSKPMFKRKRSPAKTVLSVIFVILLLAGIAFLGYSVGKPIVEFLGGRDKPAVTEPKEPEEQIKPEPAVTEAPEEEDEPEPEITEPEPEPEPVIGKKILYVTIPTGAPTEDYLKGRIEFAKVNGYYGVSVELLSVGGGIKYNTANERAISSNAISTSHIADLSAIAKQINDSGLVSYARVSALTDHIASWDKSVCYLFENSTSTWLDNSVDKGGKPWISPFSTVARDYISSIVKEISDAGFSGIIAGELEFPPFRNSDLRYVGSSVTSADRYKALQNFSNALQGAVGSDKSYAVEVDAQDVVSGRAEILKDPASLNADTVYIRYDSAAVGLRIVKTDETEISYSGLSEAEKLTVVMNAAAEALKNSGKTVIPAVTDEALIPQLVSMGYDEQKIIIY